MNLDGCSERVRSAMSAAEAYATDLGHRRLMPAHLLVAMLTDRDGAVVDVLTRLGADAGQLERKIHRELTRLPRPGGTPAPDATLTTVLDDARRQAKRESAANVDTIHLLIAISDGSPGVGRRALQDVGVTRTAIGYMVRNVPDALRTERAGGGAKPSSTGGASKSPAKKARPRRAAADEGSMLERFGRDLTQLARDGELDPIIGRDLEIRRIMQVIGRRSKNNPILIGEPGVGKTAIVEGFARRIASGDVPKNLRDKQVVEIDLSGLVAGTTLRGQFEERIKKLVDEVTEAAGRVILYIDEIHNIAGAGGSGDSGGAADMLKPALARGQMTLIGTTTPAEYRKHIEADKALERRFQEIQVDEPDYEQSLAILRGIKQRYEIHHKVRLMDSALQAAVRLSERYVLDRKLPDKAVDLVDEAASRLRMQVDSQPTELYELKRRLMNLEVEREALRQDASTASAATADKMDADIEAMKAQVAEMNERLEAEQNALERLTELKAEHEATQKLVDTAQSEGDLGRAAELKYGVIKELEREIEKQKALLDELHRDGRMVREEVTAEDIAMVVADWTGIPTTRMMESERQKLLQFDQRLSARVIGQDPAVQAIAAAVRRSRAGLQDRNRPIGNFFFVGPTGVGKTELAKALADFLFDSEDALIRIDMSEYMEQSKVNTLIGAAYGYVDSDKGGVLTEAVRRRPYSIVLFDEAEKAHPDVFNILLQVLDEGRLTDSSGRRIDFTNTIIIMTSNVGARQILDLTGRVPYEELDEKVHGILQDHFKPEFLNRLDDTVVFNALDRDALEKIAEILFRSLRKLLAEQGLDIEFTDAAKNHIIDVGYQPEYGARPLKRALLTEVQDPLALQVLQGEFGAGDVIHADLAEGGGELVFTKTAR